MRREFLNVELSINYHPAASFDFFSALYFFIARRFFCLLRLCEFFRASCFMRILLALPGQTGELFAECFRIVTLSFSVC